MRNVPAGCGAGMFLRGEGTQSVVELLIDRPVEEGAVLWDEALDIDEVARLFRVEEFFGDCEQVVREIELIDVLTALSLVIDFGLASRIVGRLNDDRFVIDRGAKENIFLAGDRRDCLHKKTFATDVGLLRGERVAKRGQDIGDSG
jgi:hypothetical protein